MVGLGQHRGPSTFFREVEGGDSNALGQYHTVLSEIGFLLKKVNPLQVSYLLKHSALALLKEAHGRLKKQKLTWFGNSGSFYRVASKTIRNLLTGMARMHPNDFHHQTGVLSKSRPGSSAADLLRLDRAMRELAEIDRPKSQIVEMRFYGGMSFDECARVLNLNVQQVKGEWRLAKAWLFRQIAAYPKTA